MGKLKEMSLSNEERIVVYVYSFRNGILSEHKCFIDNPDAPCNYILWKCDAPDSRGRYLCSRIPGEVYNNNVWFSEPNKTEAARILSKSIMKSIDEYRDKVARLQKDLDNLILVR